MRADTKVMHPNRSPHHQEFHQKSNYDRQRSESPALTIGSIVIGKDETKLRILELLGTGGFAQAYKVIEDPAFGQREPPKEYALKVVAKKKLNSQSQLDNMDREITIHHEISKVPHKNIVKMSGSFQTETHFYLKLELCSKETLLDRINLQDGLCEEMCRWIINDLVDAVSYLHSKRILHRDIKPGNIFFDNTGNTAKLGDFGLAKKFENLTTSSGSGTPNYLAPEIVNQRGHSDRTEVWAIGCTLYCMITRIPPFQMNTLEETYQKILNCDYDSEHIPASNEAKRLIRRCLELNAKKRLNVDEVKNDIWTKGIRISTPHMRSTPSRIEDSIAEMSLYSDRQPNYSPYGATPAERRESSRPVDIIPEPKVRTYTKEDIKTPTISTDHKAVYSINNNIYYHQNVVNRPPAHYHQHQPHQQRAVVDHKGQTSRPSANALVNSFNEFYNNNYSPMLQKTSTPRVTPSVCRPSSNFELWTAAEGHEPSTNRLERQLSSGFGSVSHATTSGATSSSVSPGIGCDQRIMMHQNSRFNNNNNDNSKAEPSSAFMTRLSNRVLNNLPFEKLDYEPYTSSQMRRRGSQEEVPGMLRTRDSGLGGSDPNVAIDEATVLMNIKKMARDLLGAYNGRDVHVVPFEASSLLVTRWVEGHQNGGFCCELNDQTLCLNLPNGTLACKKGRQMTYKSPPTYQTRNVNLNNCVNCNPQEYHLKMTFDETFAYMERGLNVNKRLYTQTSQNPIFLIRHHIPDNNSGGGVVMVFSNSVVQVNFGHKQRKAVLRRIGLQSMMRSSPSPQDCQFIRDEDYATWVYITPTDERPGASFLVFPKCVDRKRVPPIREEYLIADQDDALLCRMIFLELYEMLARVVPQRLITEF